MLIDVINVIPKDDFLLFLEFDNGEKKEFDCKNIFDNKQCWLKVQRPGSVNYSV